MSHVASVSPGSRGAAEMVVGPADTAQALGSGDVAVLGTPRLVALLEQATCDALSGALTPDQTSVGSRVDVVHRRPTPIGARVHASATVIEVDESAVLFEVQADHRLDSGEVAERIMVGTITRVVVDRDAFASD